ncbi:methyltransferase regulatory domain-containing protein [Bradyrhizobium diazoefficiens]|nr:class I SAM-dependent methyltransferase [Bradyrhizobium diazoefficiens]MBR0850189.1 methyltransferase regulatory domain-containing protein [Bradyrhizobium diazoefficiens]
MSWNAGYVADIGYTAGFYRETAPGHMAFAALATGRSPGRALRPRRVLELGFGQGFGLALLAAANPDVAFEGFDFNPEHVANARKLIEGAQLSNVMVTETGFEEAAARGGANDLDIVAAHGIFSWVARPVQDAIVAILRQRLQPGGLAYVSYNCMPGWAPLQPIRQLMMQVKRRNPGHSDRQLALGLDLLSKLRQSNAGYFAANPAAARHVDAMLAMDRVYLAHEYLDEHWDLFQFAEIAARLADAKLAFLASATLSENLDRYAVPAALAPLLAGIDDPELKETVRDYAANKQFRRDLFARGSGELTAGEHLRLLAQLSFVLAVSRTRVRFMFQGPVAQLNGMPELYQPIVDLLAKGIATFDALLALPVFGPSNAAILLDCLTLLVESGQVLPVIGPAADVAPAKRFNRMIVAQARAGRVHGSLASPVARTGIPVNDFGLLALAALFDGMEDAGAAAEHAMSILKALGRRPFREGRLIEDDREATRFLAENFQPVLEEAVPVWQRLGMI